MTLRDSDLPLLYCAADESSLQAQTQFLWATRIRLFGLIGAAFFGLFTWRFGSSRVDWAAVVALSCFVIVLFTEAFVLQRRPERTWYEARAAAESVKTLSWRYSVGGEPFAVGIDGESKVAELFLGRLQGLFEVVRDLDLKAPTSSEEQITQTMRDLRASSLAERKTAYQFGRVADQQSWYQLKANWNGRRAIRWTVSIVGVEIVGVICAILKVVGVLEIDILTFSGVLVATMAAWLQTKQHRTLATAYTVTALELASMQSKIGIQNTEADWARFVSDAEEAFSREHTLWKASRGLRTG